MTIARYIRQIGRGREGARALSRDQARELMGEILDGQVSDLELGAFAIAMRIKGETVDELAGFLEATHVRCLALAAPRPVVLLPSYNGARKLPNLTPLLALLLAARGHCVLVHGPLHEPSRVSTAEILGALGLSPTGDGADIEAAWRGQAPAFIDTALLCPPLARLLEVRRVVGLRNSGHTIAKLLTPFRQGRSFRVVNHTHPEYAHLLADFAVQTGADLVLLRGTEGEPVADARRRPKMDVYIGGDLCTELSLPAQDGPLGALPLLPHACDAATTAVYVQSVLRGDKPVPAPIARQVELVSGALARLDGAEAA